MTRRSCLALSSGAAMSLPASCRPAPSITSSRTSCGSKEGARIHTDEASNFKLLTEKYGYDHEAIDHSAKGYVRGDVHTNLIESFWSQVKRGINGTYVWVSKKHLQLYLREFEYRHNLRRQPALMFELLLQAFPKVRVE